MYETIKFIEKHKDRITRQQFRTLKGQCLAGDSIGAKKGLFRILNKRKEQKGGAKND